MAFSDYNKQKKLDVDSVSGTPQIDKATPIIVGSGDDSTTGNGDIIIDWTNVSSESDLAVYDQNDNLLPYEIEDFDATAETAVLWVYDSWVRDGTTQAKVLYGDGPASSEEGTASDVWGNPGQNAELVQHLNEDNYPTDDALDSSPNGNDGTVNGATSVSGEIDGAGSFDGDDDFIDIADSTSLDLERSNSIVLSGIVELTDSDFNAVIEKRNPAAGFKGYAFNILSDNSVEFSLFSENSKLRVLSDATVPQNEITHIAATYDGSSNADGVKIYINGSEVSSSASSDDLSSSITNNTNLNIGRRLDGAGYFNGDLDELKLFSSSSTLTQESPEWIQADYDASPKAGQVFFSQQAAETTDQPGSVRQTNNSGVVETTSSGVVKTNP